MADDTPRLGLGRFDQGDTDWDHTDTVEALDEHAICRGPISDRPARGEYDDELYHATDQRITWRWDADCEDWVPAGGVGAADSPVPGTSHLERVRAGTYDVGGNWTVERDGDGAAVRCEGVDKLRLAEDGAVEALEAPTDDDHVARLADLEGIDTWTPDEWELVDVSEHGFDGTESGDVVEFMCDYGEAMFVFPEGRYSFEQPFRPNDEGWSRFGLVGRPRATFVANDESVDAFCMEAYKNTSVDDCVVENVRFETDASRDMDAGIGEFAVNERLIVRNCALEGQREYYRLGGSKYGIRVNMPKPQSTAVVENVRLMDGDAGKISANYDGVIGCSVEPPNEGTIYWSGCHIAGWPDNGYYLKDGTGRSIVTGCTARNCGNQLFRFGQGDVAIANESVTDVPSSELDHDIGAHLEAQMGEGTAVIGHRAVAEYADTDVVRIRGGNEHATFRDVWIENHTTHHGLRLSSTTGGDNDVDEAGEGVAAVENVRIHQVGSPGSVRSAQVAVRRDNAILRDCSIKTDRNYHGAVHVQRGDATFENCRFDCGGVEAYDVKIGGEYDIHREIDTVRFNACEFGSGIYWEPDNGNSIGHVELVGCDLRAVDDLWVNGHPADVDEAEETNVEVENYTIFRNVGDDEQTINTDALGVAVEGWDGERMTVEYGDDRVEYREGSVSVNGTTIVGDGGGE